MTTIAEAFVTLRPETENFGRESESGIRKAIPLLAGAGLAIGAAAGVAISKGLSGAIDTEQANDKLAAGLLLTEQESERIGKVAGGLFRDAYGDSLGDVNEALKGVARNIVDLGSVSNSELRDITASAMNLAEVMDEDVGRVTRAAGQLMRNNLAPNAEAAFDIIAAAQAGAAGTTDDLIDTIEEYAADFRELGLTGEEVMGVLTAAMEAGARNTDLAADAMREFSIRMVDGSELTRESLQGLGFDAEQMTASFAAGGPAAKEAMSQVIQALADLDDPLAQQIIGVGLFGTRFEELGPQIIAAMDPATASLDNVAGASGRLGDTLNDNLGTSIEELKRKAQGMLTDGMMPIAAWINDVGIPVVERFFNKFREGLTGDQAQAITQDMNSIGLAVTSQPIEEEMSGWEQAAHSMGETIGELGVDFREFQEKDAGPALDNLGKAWEKVEPIVGNVIDRMAEKAGEGSRLTQNGLSAVTDLLGGDFRGAWENGKKTVADAWDFIGGESIIGKDEVNATLGILNDLTGGRMGDFFNLVAGTGERAAGAFVASIEWMVGHVRGLVNGLVDGINWVIGRINSALEFNVTIPGVNLPGPLPDIPSTSFGFDAPDIPTIPGLAAGGIVRARPGGTLVRVGEGGQDEAIVPLTEDRGFKLEHYGSLQLVLPNARNADELFADLRRMTDQIW